MERCCRQDLLLKECKDQGRRLSSRSCKPLFTLFGAQMLTLLNLQTFGSYNVIATGIYGNDSTATFEVQGQGQDQWVSFYHQSKINYRREALGITAC
jgi:hypothetical protein